MGRFYKAGEPCHLCGLPIADWIITTGHSLSGTIDHVIPRSLGGKDIGSNRLPAHAICNWTRGTREITPELKVECRKIVIHYFAKHRKNIPQTKKWKKVRDLATGYLGNLAGGCVQPVVLDSGADSGYKRVGDNESSA